MNREEVFNFIRDNLSIEVWNIWDGAARDDGHPSIKVRLLLRHPLSDERVVISDDRVPLMEYQRTALLMKIGGANNEAWSRTTRYMETGEYDI